MFEQQSLDAKQWIDTCETEFRARLTEVAERLLSIEHLKLIRLTGPTCSGKTTFANLLKTRFTEAGKRLHLISIDDFFYDKEILHARAEQAGSQRLDYDSVQTIDLEALRTFAREIVLEDVAECPIFDFTQGRRTGFRTLESRDEDVFLFEGIQVLYPEVNALFDLYGESVGIYIAPLSPLTSGDVTWEPNELRLLRRLVRDYHFRKTAPEQTFFLWEGVRRNEELNIFPYAHSCSYRIDSTMPYELGILKLCLSQVLPTVSKESPYRPLADEILRKLAAVAPISDALLPPDSLYQEFI